MANLNVTMLELGSRHCRTVIGEPAGTKTIFCGEVTEIDKSYCARCCQRHFVRRPTDWMPYADRGFKKGRSHPARA